MTPNSPLDVTLKIGYSAKNGQVYVNEKVANVTDKPYTYSFSVELQDAQGKVLGKDKSMDFDELGVIDPGMFHFGGDVMFPIKAEDLRGRLKVIVHFSEIPTTAAK